MLNLKGAFKTKKLCPSYIGPFQIIERVGEVAYRLALPPSMSGMHDVFHVSQLRKLRCQKLKEQINFSCESRMGRISGRRSYLGTRIGDFKAVSTLILRIRAFSPGLAERAMEIKASS
ncbi:putative retrotransposon gag protein [Trifolium medium]|uniref:Putative retrotransposon gag protein n=1 Tax=Trifolium medium TaxID=97028 RepID=A0A392PJT7_9FABA|nr:putative retrotransposon gag protein [Trifolium medium]